MTLGIGVGYLQFREHVENSLTDLVERSQMTMICTFNAVVYIAAFEDWLKTVKSVEDYHSVCKYCMRSLAFL